ncbi:hypothetical protein MBLNU459_g1352t1 [Dothideomycetes sp. NU459]
MAYSYPHSSRSGLGSHGQSPVQHPSPLRHAASVSMSNSPAYNNGPALTAPGRTSTLSSNPSLGRQYSGLGHKRGLSEATSPTKSSPKAKDFWTTKEANSPPVTPENFRSALRSLPQAPGGSPVASHNRAQSHDSKMVFEDGPTSPQLKSRPHSLAISRSDSVRAPIHDRSNRQNSQHVHFASSPNHLDKSELESLQKSSTGHLRTLSKFAENGDEDFAIKSPEQEVVGLHGRRRLQRTMTSRGKKGSGMSNFASGWQASKWMDQQRQFLQAYEYLCHIGEAKEWIEDIIHTEIPPIVQLEHALRDGVTLAEVVQAIHPERSIRIFRHEKLQFRHSDNIALFFRFLAEMELPELFRFELVDLYEKKNIPKVIYCIHALSWLLFRKGIVDFRIGNLVGQLQFEDHELEAMQKGLDKAGISMPNFSGMSANFGEPEPEPEPVESEEDRIERELAENEAAVEDLQAQIRGAMVRIRLGDTMQDLWDAEGALVDLQSRIRGDFSRQIANYRLDMRRFAVEMQAAARGFIVRSRQRHRDTHWKTHENNVVTLQSLFRARKARTDVQYIRSRMQRHDSGVRKLQAAIRGALARWDVGDQYHAAHEAEGGVQGLQAAIRGALLRGRFEQQLEDTREADKHRQQTYDVLWALGEQEDQTVGLQSLARALLLRRDIGMLLSDLEAEEDGIAALQSQMRGRLVRHKFAEKQKFYKENMEKVIKVQSFIRAKQQGEAYKSLTSGKNPPVGTVKNFVHLLNDSDFDFDEELEFERMRKTVVQRVRQNEMAEQYVDQLDIKIALLVKNKITLDEVVKHQKHFGGHVGSLLNNREIASKDPFDLKALNKNSRKKLEHYQELFFVLQTQPQYVARLFKKFRAEGMAEQEGKRIELLMMGLFGFAQKRREEYYLLKLVARSIQEEAAICNSLQDYLRGNFFWGRLLSAYLRSPRDRKYMRDLFGPLVRDSIFENTELDLESDPMQIYRASINNEELRTGQRSRRNPDIPREEAIRDPETREMFIAHLQDLRDICDHFFQLLEETLPRMPYGMRFIAQQTFQILCASFPGENQQHLLQVVGHWLWKSYLMPALEKPEMWGVIDRGLSPLHRRNLSEVSKVLGQVYAGRLFGGEHVYLQPLNTWVGESIERVEEIMSNLINVRDAERQFDIDEFNDLFARTKPTLYIKMADIFAIHHLVANDLPVLCPSQDDVLREIIRELGSAKSNENEMMGVGSNEISLQLAPKFHEQQDPDADIKSLFMETKRLVLYIIRIQSGANLLEIMVRPITAEDDDKWLGLLDEEVMNQRRQPRAPSAYGSVVDDEPASTLLDITSMSYAEVKSACLENILILEQHGRLSRHNQYQDLLNAIALDIRTKHRRRVQRTRELEGVRATLSQLESKAGYLDEQLQSYNDYIEQAMITLQNKKGKKRFLLPFTKQYNHERELARSGRTPKFGSFKYSARALAEKGVLVDWDGYTPEQWRNINLTISSDEIGIFHIEGSAGSLMIPGASASVPLDDLLQAQFDNHQFMNLFKSQGGGDGGLKLNVNLFLHLVFKKFYREE